MWRMRDGFLSRVRRASPEASCDTRDDQTGG
jgi:hypothetical protein